MRACLSCSFSRGINTGATWWRHRHKMKVAAWVSESRLERKLPAEEQWFGFYVNKKEMTSLIKWLKCYNLSFREANITLIWKSKNWPIFLRTTHLEILSSKHQPPLSTLHDKGLRTAASPHPGLLLPGTETAKLPKPMRSLGICLVFVFVKHLNDIEKGQLVIEKRKKIRTNRYYGTMEGKALVSSNSSHIQKKEAWNFHLLRIGKEQMPKHSPWYTFLVHRADKSYLFTLSGI